MLSRRLARFALVPLLAAALAPAAAPAAAPSVQDDCPGGFLVFQPLPVGPLKLPAATYQITVFNMSCNAASTALQSFIGEEELPPPWTVSVPTKTFFNRSGSFSLASSKKGPGDPPGCPLFTIASRDRIGTVPLPRGRYALRPGGGEPLTCLAAARVLIRALEQPPGASSGWQPTALPPGSRPGLTLRNGSDQTVTIRRLDGRTAGGGYSPPN